MLSLAVSILGRAMTNNNEMTATVIRRTKRGRSGDRHRQTSKSTFDNSMQAVCEHSFAKPDCRGLSAEGSNERCVTSRRCIILLCPGLRLPAPARSRPLPT